MNITDELREAINELRVECEEKEGCGVLWYPEPPRDRFSAIADRIDEELANYIPLPKDADGVPIHIGDELEWLEGNRLTVNGIGEGGTLFYVDVQGDVQWTASGNKRHVTPDSWERIIEDVRRRTSDYYCNQIPCDFRKMADEMVERCKRLAGEDA